jgi:hypothetical protein
MSLAQFDKSCTSIWNQSICVLPGICHTINDVNGFFPNLLDKRHYEAIINKKIKAKRTEIVSCHVIIERLHNETEYYSQVINDAFNAI